jgi:hypothetical protein
MEALYDYFLAQGLSDDECRRLCDANNNLVEKMISGVVCFKYRKKDGSERVAHGTLRNDMMPDTKGNKSTLGIASQVYYDIEKGAFRCFNKISLIEVID